MFGKLLRTMRDNPVAMIAMAMLPLAALISGGIDVSRLYLAKARLQQACDAGALAGREAMGAGAWTTTGDGNALSRSNDMFAANFKPNAYGTGTVTRHYTEQDGTVTGNVSVAVPMTVTRIFGLVNRTLGVRCDARMETPANEAVFIVYNGAR